MEETLATNNNESSSEVIFSFTHGAPMLMLGLLQCDKKGDQCNVAMMAFMRTVVEQKVQREVGNLCSGWPKPH